MAIQLRRGAYADFDPTKMVPAEVGIVTSGDPNTDDGKAAYVAFSAGNAKRLATVEDIATDLQEATDDAVGQATARAEAAAESVEASAAQIATNTADIADLKADLSQAESDILNGEEIIELNKYTWVVGRINGSGQPYTGDGHSKRTSDFIDWSSYGAVYIQDTKNLSNYLLTIFAYKKSDDSFVEIVGSAAHALPYRFVPNSSYKYKFEWRNGNGAEADVSGLIGRYASEIKYIPGTVFDYTENEFAKIESKNLIDKTAVVSGEYVNSATGAFNSNANFWRTGYIPVEPNTYYTLRYINQVAFYDSRYVYISGVKGYSADTSASVSSFQSPTGACYIVVCGHVSQLDSDQLEKGNVFTSYYPFKKKVSEAYLTESTDISSVLKFATSQVRIKLIGDSITHGVGGTGFAMDGDLIIQQNGTYYRNPNGYCWANLLTAQLESEFNCVVTNNGVKGRTTTYFVENVDVLVGDDNDIVICMLGTNNRGTQELADSIIGDIQFLYDYCYDRGQKFIIMASSPASNTDESAKYIHMDDVNHYLHAVATKNRIGFIDVYSQFYNYAWYRGIDFTTLLADGLHPNDAGYYVMYRIIAEALGVPAKPENASWDYGTE